MGSPCASGHRVNRLAVTKPPRPLMARATGAGACLGMIAGLGVTAYYMVMNQPWLRGIFGVTSPVDLWYGIAPISAGVFGVPLGFAVIVLVSLLTAPPSAAEQRVAEDVRYPA